MAAQESVLITGANGFVGSRLCAACLKEGYRVIAGVRKTADLTLLDGLVLENRYGDITQTDTLPAMVTDVDFIIHNAGLVKAKSAQKYFDVNETGTRNLLDAVAKHNPTVKKVVYISSMAAAGPSLNGHPVTESDPPHPITIYGQSKLGGEKVCLEYADRLPLLMLRPPGVYGPGDRETLAFFKAAHYRLKPLFGDLKRKVQMVHVDDLCRAVLKALKTQAKSGELFFIAERQSYTLRELGEMLVQGSGRSALPIYFPVWLFRVIATVSELSFRLVRATPMLTREKADELLASWEVSTTKAASILGFESAVPFAQGARETFAWYRSRGWL